MRGASTSAVVLVNGEPTVRTGPDFYRSVPALPLKENTLKIQAVTVSPEQVATETRTVLVPAVPETYSYDADGNLLRDGLWTYAWDGENRLISAELRTDVNATGRRLEFAYDAQGRRIAKVVKHWNSSSSSWETDQKLRFLYDGWNLVAELDYTTVSAPGTVLRTHVWGLDLSNSPQGAGGIGGLLWSTVQSTGKSYAPGYDGNGNITVYVDLSTGSSAGNRDYGPFGEPVLSTGIASTLPFAFSSKYRDSETELYYYGLRYYNPSTGRWLSRDPIGERDGPNLYGMVHNDPVDFVDRLGLYTLPPPAEVDSFTVRGGMYSNNVDAGDSTMWWHFQGVSMRLALKVCYSKEMVRIKQETRSIIRYGTNSFTPGAWAPDSHNVNGTWWSGSSWIDTNGQRRGMGHTPDGNDLSPEWRVNSSGGPPRETAYFYDTPGIRVIDNPAGYPLTYIMRARTWVEDIATGKTIAEKRWRIWFQLNAFNSGTGGFNEEG